MKVKVFMSEFHAESLAGHCQCDVTNFSFFLYFGHIGSMKFSETCCVKALCALEHHGMYIIIGDKQSCEPQHTSLNS